MRGRRPVRLRRDLVVLFGALLVAAILVAIQAIVLMLPRLQRPQDAILFVTALVVVDLLVLVGGASWFLRTRFLRPVGQMVEDVQRIADGDRSHRVRPLPVAELEEIRESVNTMADRLVHNQDVLAQNIASLDATNEELVAARDEVIRAARLASVGTLAAGIAHEVGNPLAALLGFVDLARQRAGREGQDTELLDLAHEEAQRIDRIIRTLLAYARNRDEGAEAVDPFAVIRRVHDLLDAQGHLDRALVSWPEPMDDVWVRVQPQHLEQILVNLVLNGLDAVEGRPDARLGIEVTLEEADLDRFPRRREDDPPGINYLHRRRVARDWSSPGPDPLLATRERLVIQVTDNGPGVPSELLGRIFDPFFTTKEPGAGTGLGLAICARLAEGMGGEVGVENLPEGGARFRLQLPVVHEDAELTGERA